MERKDGNYSTSCNDIWFINEGTVHQYKFCPTCGRKVIQMQYAKNEAKLIPITHNEVYEFAGVRGWKK